VAAGECPEPEEVFVPFGTGGTAAGLAIGLALGGLRTRVMAIRVIDRLLANRPRLLAKARAILRLCESRGDHLARPAGAGSNLSVLHDFIGAGYGHPTAPAEEAVALFGELEGLKLETTYTGKAAAAFLRRSGQRQGPLLFWLTYSSADLGRWVDGLAAVPGGGA
jgi:D-cysteine desulfhydrase